jgi:hypothetical protein
MASSDIKGASSQETSNVKKPFIKNNTLMGIIIAIGVIGAIAIFVMSLIKSKSSSSSENAAKTEITKISDYITDMVSTGTIGLKYVDSAQRKKLMIAGKDTYYNIQHNGTNLYFWQGTYTQAATTDEMKFTEATSDSNAKIFSDCVTDFAVENYNQGNDTFSEGKVKLRIRVEKDGKSDYLNFEIPLPTAD